MWTESRQGGPEQCLPRLVPCERWGLSQQMGNGQVSGGERLCRNRADPGLSVCVGLFVSPPRPPVGSWGSECMCAREAACVSCPCDPPLPRARTYSAFVELVRDLSGSVGSYRTSCRLGRFPWGTVTLWDHDQNQRLDFLQEGGPEMVCIWKSAAPPQSHACPTSLLTPHVKTQHRHPNVLMPPRTPWSCIAF